MMMCLNKVAGHKFQTANINYKVKSVVIKDKQVATNSPHKFNDLNIPTIINNKRLGETNMILVMLLSKNHRLELFKVATMNKNLIFLMVSKVKGNQFKETKDKWIVINDRKFQQKLEAINYYQSLNNIKGKARFNTFKTTSRKEDINNQICTNSLR